MASKYRCKACAWEGPRKHLDPDGDCPNCGDTVDRVEGADGETYEDPDETAGLDDGF